MATDERSIVSSDVQQWKKVFNNLVLMLQSKQTQIISLVKERKLLQDHIKTQYDQWESDVRFFEDQILEMKRDFSMEELARSLDREKFDLMMGLNQRKALTYKLKLDHADSELANFKMMLDDCLLNKSSTSNDDISGANSIESYIGKSGGRESDTKSVNNKKEEKQRSKILEGEIAKLKDEYEKLSSEKSALLLENEFVWNQYRTIENEFTEKLKSTCVEVEQANEKIEKLLASMEELQLLNNEKDATVLTLKTEMAKMEADSMKRKEEISRLNRELEVFRKSGSSSATPLLRRCSVNPKISGVRDKNNSGSDRSNVDVMKMLPNSEKGSRDLKRRGDIIPISQTPKLFSAKFKVPKLKGSSQRVELKV